MLKKYKTDVSKENLLERNLNGAFFLGSSRHVASSWSKSSSACSRSSLLLQVKCPSEDSMEALSAAATWVWAWRPPRFTAAVTNVFSPSVTDCWSVLSSLRSQRQLLAAQCLVSWEIYSWFEIKRLGAVDLWTHRRSCLRFSVEADGPADLWASCFLDWFCSKHQNKQTEPNRSDRNTAIPTTHLMDWCYNHSFHTTGFLQILKHTVYPSVSVDTHHKEKKSFEFLHKTAFSHFKNI